VAARSARYIFHIAKPRNISTPRSLARDIARELAGKAKPGPDKIAENAVWGRTAGQHDAPAQLTSGATLAGLFMGMK